MKLFHAKMKASKPAAAIPGPAKGSAILRNVAQKPWPSDADMRIRYQRGYPQNSRARSTGSEAERSSG